MTTYFPPSSGGGGGLDEAAVQALIDASLAALETIPPVVDDVEVTEPSKGVITRSENSTRWRLRANDSGSITHETVPPGSIWSGTSFETGTLEDDGWTVVGDGVSIDSTTAYDGTKSVKLAGGGVSNSDRYIERTVYIGEGGGTVRYAFKKSTEQIYDNLYFYIDGVLDRQHTLDQLTWSYPAARDITAGEHVIRFAYEKDASGNAGDDAAWIDNVVLTNAVLPDVETKTIPTIDQVGTVMTVSLDGGGDVIPDAMSVKAKVPFACTVTEWELNADASGSIIILVERAPTADPTTFTQISGSSDPTLSSQQTAKDSAISGDWSDVTLDAGDWLRFVVSGAATTITNVSLALTLTRS